jgi:hypothetical protein
MVFVAEPLEIDPEVYVAFCLQAFTQQATESLQLLVFIGRFDIAGLSHLLDQLYT